MSDAGLLQAIDTGLDILDSEEARSNFFTYYEYCFSEPLGQHHIEWTNLIKPVSGVPGDGKHNRLLIEAPRGFGKTTFMARYILWSIAHNHDVRVTYVSGDDQLAHDVSEEIGEHITTNSRLHRVFPDLIPNMKRWSKAEKFIGRNIVSKDPTVRASGMLSTGVGGRCNLLIFDDPTSFRTSIQLPQLREHMKTIFSDVWMKHLLPDGVAIIICTPWHVNDVVGQVEDSGAWHLWKKPALDENDESTWPEMWPTEILHAERLEDLGSFNRQKMLVAMSGFDRSFDYNVIESCFIAKDRISREWPRYVGVDLSSALGGKGSWNCIFVMAVDPNNIKHIDQIIRFKGESTETIDHLVDVFRRTGFVLANVENNAYQQSLISFIEKIAPGMPVEGYRTGSQKFDLRQGVPSMHAEMKTGGWVIEYGPEHEAPSHTCDTCMLIEELSDFPHGKYSDIVMAMWLATRAHNACNPFGLTEDSTAVYRGDDDFEEESVDEGEVGPKSAMDHLNDALDSGDVYHELSSII